MINTIIKLSNLYPDDTKFGYVIRSVLSDLKLSNTTRFECFYYAKNGNICRNLKLHKLNCIGINCNNYKPKYKHYEPKV